MYGGSGLLRATRCAVSKMVSAEGTAGFGDGEGCGAAAAIATTALAARSSCFIIVATFGPPASFHRGIEIRKRAVRIWHEPKSEIPACRVEVRPSQFGTFRQQPVVGQLFRRYDVAAKIRQRFPAMRLH